VASPTDCKSAV